MGQFTLVTVAPNYNVWLFHFSLFKLAVTLVMQDFLAKLFFRTGGHQMGPRHLDGKILWAFHKFVYFNVIHLRR
jgi:hypothetical protein